MSWKTLFVSGSGEDAPDKDTDTQMARILREGGITETSKTVSRVPGHLAGPMAVMQLRDDNPGRAVLGTTPMGQPDPPADPTTVQPTDIYNLAGISAQEMTDIAK